MKVEDGKGRKGELTFFFERSISFIARLLNGLP